MGYDYILSYEAYVGTVIGNVVNDLTAATFSIEGRLFSGGSALTKVKSEDKACTPLKLKDNFAWKGVDGKTKVIHSPLDSDVKYSYWRRNHKIINKCSTQKAGWQWEFSRPENGSHGVSATWIVDTETAVVRLRNEFVIKVTKEE